MPRKIDVSLLEPMLDSGESFELTPDEYERVVGWALPLTDDYLKYRSPVARAAKKAGYRIRIEEKQIVQRILVFEKRGGKKK